MAGSCNETEHVRVGKKPEFWWILQCCSLWFQVIESWRFWSLDHLVLFEIQTPTCPNHSKRCIKSNQNARAGPECQRWRLDPLLPRDSLRSSLSPCVMSVLSFSLAVISVPPCYLYKVFSFILRDVTSYDFLGIQIRLRMPMSSILGTCLADGLRIDLSAGHQISHDFSVVLCWSF